MTLKMYDIVTENNDGAIEYNPNPWKAREHIAKTFRTELPLMGGNYSIRDSSCNVRGLNGESTIVVDMVFGEANLGLMKDLLKLMAEDLYKIVTLNDESLGSFFENYTVRIYSMVYKFGGLTLDLIKRLPVNVKNELIHGQPTIREILNATSLGDMYDTLLGFETVLPNQEHYFFPVFKDKNIIKIMTQRRVNHANVIFKVLRTGVIQGIPYELFPYEPDGHLMGTWKKSNTLIPTITLDTSNKGRRDIFNENDVSIELQLGIRFTDPENRPKTHEMEIKFFDELKNKFKMNKVNEVEFVNFTK